MVTEAVAERETFDPARDRALIKAGTHFYCYGHLGARPNEEQSEDPRYCRDCCEFLSQEAKLSHSKADWVPKVARGKASVGKDQEAPQVDHVPPVKGDTISTQPSTPPAKRQRIMSTPEAPQPSAVKKRRGPKQKDLPVEEIKRLEEEEGLGSKRIEALLKEQGIDVSYKTIQRILKGQRKTEVTHV